MKYLLMITAILLLNSENKRIESSFAQKKCHCFSSLVQFGESEKKKNDKGNNPSKALFGGTAVSMNLDSCAYTLLSKKERAYIDRLDSIQLSNFYSEVNLRLSIDCKSARKYRAKLK